MSPVALDEWLELLLGFQTSALHVEQHPSYASDWATMHAWLAGSTTPPPHDPADPWTAATRPKLQGGARLERVRLHQDPPTPYQQWLREWASPRRIQAGERHWYLTWPQAEALGLVPVPPTPGRDWWLLDGSWLLVFTHDDTGHLVGAERSDNPSLVAQAQAWWDTATTHAEIDVTASV